MADVYITKNNFSKIANIAIGELTDGINAICSRVYGYKDISKYLNHREIKDMECKRLLIEDTNKYIEEYFEKQRKKLGKKSSGASSPFVFLTAGSPKFHYNKDCDFITKDYINFYIPPEIEGRGENEIEKFRSFANSNKQLLIDKKEDVFIFRLKNQFQLKNDISKLSISNSGVRNIILGVDFDVSTRIDEIMESIDLIGQTETGKDVLRRYIYLDHYKQNRVSEGNKIALEILMLKSELIDLLVKFHLKKNEKSGFSFEKKFLESIGFEGCRACGKQFDL